MGATAGTTLSRHEVALGRRLKALLVVLSALGVVWVLAAGHYWHHLGRITVSPTRNGDQIQVQVESPAHRAGLADLTAVARTSGKRTLRIQADVDVPKRGIGQGRFDFTPLLVPGEHVTSFKVKK